MASTNFTTHYEIPLPLGTDLTTPMDYNTSMEAVDTALFGAVTDADQAATLAGQAIETANTAASAAGDVAADLTIEKAKIVALQTRMTNAENEIDDVRADVQDSICAYNEPTATSTHHYNVDDYFFYNDTLYVATVEINIGDTITPNTNCDTTTITAELLSGGSGVGNLADLTTTDKDNCVDAINEINSGLTELSNDLTESVSVTADGIKTYSQLLNELFALIDTNKVTPNSCLMFMNGDLMPLTFGLAVTDASGIIMSSAYISTNYNVYTCQLKTTGSTYYSGSISSGGFTKNDESSSVYPSGRKITFKYN